MIKKIIFALIVVVFIACNNNSPTLDVQGKWKLMKVENAFAQQSIDLSSKNIIFDFGSSEVTVTGNNSGDYYINNGNYPYSLQLQNSLSTTFQSMTLTINGTQYLYLKTENEMTLDNGYLDGDKLTFSRQ